MNVDPFALRLSTPLSTAADTIERREGFLVRVTVDGAEGVGEATPLPPWTESLADCRSALAGAPEDPRDAREAVDPERTPAAAHAVELALLDARTRAAGVPLAAELAEDHAARVPVNATVGDADAATTAERAAAAADEGFDAVKVKVGGREIAADAARTAAVREAVGPELELRADANGAWRGISRARHALSALATSDLAYVEQPLPAGDPDALAAVAGGDVPVAVDESLAEHPLSAVLAAGAADVAVLKPMALGGPARAAAAGRQAIEAGVQPVVTTTVDAVHARTAAVHVAAALPDPPACGLATAGMLAEDLAADPCPVADGEVVVPEGPGNLGGTT